MTLDHNLDRTLLPLGSDAAFEVEALRNLVSLVLSAGLVVRFSQGTT